MMTSQRFIDSRTGEIVTTIPLSQIAYFDEYNGPVLAGGRDEQAKQVMAEKKANAQGGAG